MRYLNWELQYVRPEWGMIHLGLAYLHRRAIRMDKNSPNKPMDSDLELEGEHQMQIGILLGRFIITYYYQP